MTRLNKNHVVEILGWFVVRTLYVRERHDEDQESKRILKQQELDQYVMCYVMFSVNVW